MAAQAFKIYNLAKKKIGNGTLPLSSSAFRASLYTSASNAATLTLGVIGSVTNEVAEANGYSSSGKALASEAWTVGASAKQYKFDADDPFWSANGGSISNIKFLVLWLSGASAGGRHLLAMASLTSSQFALAAGNRLTVQFAAGGILTLA
jgi:hypothetical protein